MTDQAISVPLRPARVKMNPYRSKLCCLLIVRGDSFSRADKSEVESSPTRASSKAKGKGQRAKVNSGVYAHLLSGNKTNQNSYFFPASSFRIFSPFAWVPCYFCLPRRGWATSYLSGNWATGNPSICALLFIVSCLSHGTIRASLHWAVRGVLAQSCSVKLYYARSGRIKNLEFRIKNLEFNYFFILHSSFFILHSKFASPYDF